MKTIYTVLENGKKGQLTTDDEFINEQVYDSDSIEEEVKFFTGIELKRGWPESLGTILDAINRLFEISGEKIFLRQSEDLAVFFGQQFIDHFNAGVWVKKEGGYDRILSNKPYDSFTYTPMSTLISFFPNRGVTKKILLNPPMNNIEILKIEKIGD
jgi:hypothetical protein